MGARGWALPQPMLGSPLPTTWPRKEAPAPGVLAGAWKVLVLFLPAMGGHRQSGLGASQAAPAQGHLALAEVTAGTEPLVLGVGTCTAEEQGLLLKVALLARLGEGWVQVVHLPLSAVTGHLQPAWVPPEWSLRGM